MPVVIQSLEVSERPAPSPRPAQAAEAGPPPPPAPPLPTQLRREHVRRARVRAH